VGGDEELLAVQVMRWLEKQFGLRVDESTKKSNFSRVSGLREESPEILVESSSRSKISRCEKNSFVVLVLCVLAEFKLFFSGRKAAINYDLVFAEAASPVR
jgi:hypothetical protein